MAKIVKLFGGSSGLGLVLRKWRGRRGISREQLAKRAGLERTDISEAESGSQKISLENISKLSIALETIIVRPFARERAGASVRHRRSSTLGELVNILLVEDDSDDVDLTMHALQRVLITNRIRLVHDGFEALDFLFCRGKYLNRAIEELPQIILLDLHLPKMSGLEVLRRVKADPLTRGIPVVILTSSSSSADIAVSKRLGADGYIVKPVDIESLSQVTPQLNFQWALLKTPPTAGL